MKELSVEEKAKRYDEAIEKFDVILNLDIVKKSGTIFADDVRKILPELKESDDKKIRKALVEMVHDTTGDSLWIDYNVHKEDAIAWLEKQGEKKPIFRAGDTIRKVSTGDVVTISEVDIKNKEYRLTNTGFIPFEYESLWQLVEQKPNPVLGVEIPFGAKDSELQEVSYHIPEGFHAEIEGNKVIIKKGEQKPAWSDRDKKEFEQLLNILHANGYESFDIWLKSLKERVQPQLKQEWSEEDEKKLSCFERVMSEYWFSGETKQDLINWLRSLRPQNHWKPTKRQLESLKMAAKYYMSGKISKNYTGKDLTEILEQLKKHYL